MRWFFLALVLAIVSCHPQHEPPSPNPLPVPDSNLCGEMCVHLNSLGCVEGNAVYNSDLPGPRNVPNMTCQAFCEDLQAKGVFLNPKCLIKVGNCSEIESARKNTCN